MTHQIKKLFKSVRSVDQPAPLSTSASFSALYERTHLSVFRYIYGLTGGPQEDAEDLTAEAFARAWRARRSFRGDEGAALGWLMKIARHLVIDDHRRRQARPVMEGEIPLEFPTPLPSPEETAADKDEQETLWWFLGSLPEGPREMLVLRYLLSWRVDQIAEYLEIPDNTVSVTIHRTLERLHQEWPQPQED